MKKIYTIILLLLSFGVFAQQKVSKKVEELVAKNVAFKSYTVLTATAEKPSNDIDKVVANASNAKINQQDLTRLMTNKDQYIEVNIPYRDNVIAVQLYKVDILAEGFHIDTDKSKSIPYKKGLHYRGIVKGDSNSLVSFNFFNNELSGVISNRRFANLVVGKLDKKNNTTDYIVYSDSNMKISNNFECGIKEVAEAKPNQTSSAPSSVKCVTIYFEIDNEIYVANSSNTTTTTNWMTSVFNNVQTIYANDGITTALKSMFIWTTPDPYDGIGDSSSDYLYKFNEVRPVFDGDLGQLLGLDEDSMGRSLGGVAVGLNGLCSQDNFSYSDVSFGFSSVPTYSWTIQVITHELGHLMGSQHTHSCAWNGDNTAIDGCGPTANEEYTEGSCDIGPIPSPAVKGTIMSYCHLINNVGISFNNGFGPQPAARILSKIDATTCLSTDCINTCINTVANIGVSAVTNTSANITWSDASGATNWELTISPYNSSTSNTWIPISTNSYLATGLQPNKYYKVRVRPICDFGLEAPDQQAIIATSADYCSGIEITDTGGTLSNYKNSETYIRTIIPNLPNKKIALTFSSFDLEVDFDYLYVYDGNSTSAPDLSNGGFTGVVVPGPFLSTAADGSLTIKFYSDGGVTNAGYVANIACESTLANPAFEPNIDFTYFPNPTRGNVTITSKTNIDEVLVYNVEGRLLYQNKVNGQDTKVDISTFANGTYFFKLKFNNKEANFKILKMN